MPILTHSDLDGFVSALGVMSMYNIAPNRVYHYSYASYRDDQWKRLLDYQLSPTALAGDLEEVWFTDLSLRDGELDWVRTKQKRSLWHWIDHHKSSADFSAPEDVFDHVELILEEDFCAADILFNMYQETGNRPHPTLAVWTALAHDRDLWIREHAQLTLELTMLLRIKGFEKGGWADLLELAKITQPATLLVKLRDEWAGEMKKYESSLKAAGMTAQVSEVAGVPIKLCYGSEVGYASDISEMLYESGDEVIIMLHVLGDGVVANLRTKRDDVDMADMAAALFSGGGHPQAAGGRLNERHIRGGYIAINRSIKDFLEPPAPESEPPKKIPAGGKPGGKKKQTTKKG